MSLRTDQAKFALLVADLITHAAALGYEVTFGEAYRPDWVAAEYARQGRGIKNSFHCVRLAIDLNIFKGGVLLTDGKDFAELGAYWTLHGGTWGGKFTKPDGGHFSLGE